MSAIRCGKYGKWCGVVLLAGIMVQCLGPPVVRADEPFFGNEVPLFQTTAPAYEELGPATETVDQEARISELERQLAELRASLGVQTAPGEITADPTDVNAPVVQFLEPTGLLEMQGALSKPAAAAAAVKHPVVGDSGVLQADKPPAYNDSKGFTNAQNEPPVPFGWYPTGAGMGGFPPVPSFITEGKSLHDAIEQNLSVRLRAGGIVRLYGFGRGDLDVSTHIFNDIQNPFFLLPGEPGFRLPNSTIPVDPNRTYYSLYPRLTRLGVEYYSLPIKALDGALAQARVEIDFLTSAPPNPESRELLRLRLAYGMITYHDWAFLAGQDWDIASPLIPSINDNTLQWNNGNTGDRRPQFKVLYDHDFGDGHRLQFQNGIALMDAINSIDRDGDGVRDNEYSGIPGYEGRVGFVAPSWVEGKKMLGGFWGIWAAQRTAVPIAGRSQFDVWSYGADLHLPLWSCLTFRTEIFHGENLDDFRGGIAQGVNLTTGQEIATTGGWVEFVTQPVSWCQNSIGYSVDDPQNSDVPTGGRTLNRAVYFGNRFLLGRGIVVGADVQRWQTRWNGLDIGNAWLFKTFMSVSF